MKKIRLFALAVIMIAAGTFFFTSKEVVKADEVVTENVETETVTIGPAKDLIIKDGISIGGIDVSGMTADEATAAVNEYVDKLLETWITLVGPKNTLRYQLKDLGLTAKVGVAVQEAVSIGNSGNLIKRFKAEQDLEKEDRVIDMGLSIDKQLTGNKIHYQLL